MPASSGALYRTSRQGLTAVAAVALADRSPPAARCVHHTTSRDDRDIVLALIAATALRLNDRGPQLSVGSG
ncbi:MAG: hypothetical protein ACLP50_24865 [Solirubrobacteraceae bacterium]